MFKNLFKPKTKDTLENASAQVPSDQAAYVIGDVHGCLTQLKELLNAIKDHAARQDVQNCSLVFLGDLIDRGPHSRGVIDFLVNYKPDFADTVFLMGNHEEMFLRVLQGDASKLEAWFDYGGRDCARSYGVTDLGQVFTHPKKVLERLQEKVPQTHINFIESFQDYYVFGDYLCVHAGINPKLPLEQQTTRDLRWIRHPFLSSKKAHPYKIIHGHSIVEAPEIHSNRIALDTGAYKSGPLTAAFLQKDKVIFLQSSEIVT